MYRYVMQNYTATQLHVVLYLKNQRTYSYIKLFFLPVQFYSKA